MERRAKWADQERRRERNGLEASGAASRDGGRAKELAWDWKAQADEPAALRVSVRVEEPTTRCAPTWVELRLPDGALVRVLPGVDAVTFACVLAVATELSARKVTSAPLAAQVASQRGGR
jgi:hypothetical protein